MESLNGGKTLSRDALISIQAVLHEWQPLPPLSMDYPQIICGMDHGKHFSLTKLEAEVLTKALDA